MLGGWQLESSHLVDEPLALKCNRVQSSAINCNQVHSTHLVDEPLALKCNQVQSIVINCNQL